MKMDRLVSIIMLLLERKTMSASELARTFDVSTRTIYRDIDTLGQAGIPVVTYPGAGGGIGIMDEYKVDKRLFTVSDITSLLIGLGGVHSALSGSEIAHTLAKVKGMIPEEQRGDIEFQTNQIAIDLTPWGQSQRLRETLSIIKTALAEKRTLAFDYTNAFGKTTSREVEPYRLLHKGSSWYLQGYCLVRDAFRTFRFFRMDKLRLTENSFAPRDFDPAALDILGPPDVPMVEACIRFGDDVRRDIEEYYGEGVITEEGDGMYMARVMIADSEQNYNLFFMYGDRCECLYPPHVRKYIRDKARSIADMHSEN